MSSPIAVLETQARPALGTGPARQLRRDGLIPGILYGAKKDPVSFAINAHQLLKELQKPHYHTHLFEMSLEGKKHKVLIKNVQVHPVTDVPLHIDLLRVDATARLQVQIPFTFLNEEKSPGIKRGGVLNIVHHDLLLSCPPDGIPESLTIDLGGYEIGQTIHLSMINLPAGVTSTLAPESTIATIVAPSGLKSEDEATSEEEETPEEAK